MITLLLIACMSKDDSLQTALDDIDAAADSLGMVVSDHGAEVAAATTIEEVATAESAWTADWSGATADLRDALDMLGSCAMDDEDHASHDDAMTSMDAIDAAGTAHVTTMAACTTVEDCLADETAFASEISGYTGQIQGCRDGWEDGSVECSMEGMSGMGDDSGMSGM
jgi:hypothetical protein